jgi:Gamma-glutamyltranspeptidase
LITPTWPPAASVAFSIIMDANFAAWALFRLRPHGQRRGLHVHDRADRRQRRRGAGRGFLLNNELTDFNFDSLTHPNRVEGGKRPRSSMSPTIVLEDGQPLLALGSPGGSTIITVVLQILLDCSTWAPRSHRPSRRRARATTATLAEPAFVGSPEGAGA